ncbi:DUF2567 domain-containing protein [Streptomyces bambusae]|uniref:DUF2567 domain-containing protein n=1 Tax=Streptomyces bambusae TaxID=1550616 RepID=UPI001CFE5B59|nr:DUF2567 domain-containing protein [Streptomyces bambusae]MCB5167838.1 DUF2567 domain-containing protein [Streptomyces bambusae]
MTEAFSPPPPAPAPEDPDAPPTPTLAEDLKSGAAVMLAVALSGALLAVLWAWLAPRVQYVSDGTAVFLGNTENEGRIGSDGTFLLIALGLGLVSAGLAFLYRRNGGPAVVIGLGLGALLASVLGWRLGIHLGPSRDVVAAAKAAGKGVPFDAPLQLLAHGVLLVWPVVAVAAHLGLVGLFGPRDPEVTPEWPEGYPPPYAHPQPAPAANPDQAAPPAAAPPADTPPAPHP